MKSFRILTLLSFLLISDFAFAQHQDFGSWMTFNLDKKLTDRVSVGLTQELRLRDNLTRLNLLYTNFGVDIKATNFLKVSLVYRFIDKYKADNSFGQRHRLYFDLAFKVKPGRFSLAYRARFQWEFRGRGYSSEYGNVPEIYFRNLFKASYKLTNKFSPYVGTELRWQIQNPRIYYHNGFDRSRFIFGCDYSINKRNTLGAYYLLQKEWNVIDPETLYILGLEYSISF